MNYNSKPDTIEHINQVNKLIASICISLMERAKTHDKSKLESPEKEIFDKFTPQLATSTYGSKEYKQFLKEMKIALDHHYSNNRHHPEYFSKGIVDMTLVDLIEMLCDWKAATLRHKDGNIYKSIEINSKRFGYSNELKQIFLNTIKEYFKEKK